MSNLVALVPLVLFLILALAVSLVVRRRTHAAGGGFVKEYFIGNRALGGFVLAMTTIATYGSVSSFVGGPGQAWLVGWGWVYMAVVQVTALVLLYGILGKKMALVSRKLDAVTVIDVIRARYSSNALANVSAVVVVLFFAATMVAQFVGGAKHFEAVTGYSYLVGLVLLGVAVVLFTTIGGFRGVAVTDAICGVAMLIGIIGYSVSVAGAIPMLGTSAESETVIVHLANVMSSHGALFAVVAGVILAGILAATMSTADSQLLAAASSVSQDIAVEFMGVKLSGRRSLLVARLTVAGIALVGLVLAWNPNSSVFRVVSFAWAGFGAAFGPVMLLSLFWRRSNRQGAMAGMIAGGAMVFLWKFALAPLGGVFAIYELLPAFIAALAADVIVSLATAAPDASITRMFDEVTSSGRR